MRVVYPFEMQQEGGSFLIRGLPPLDNVTTYGETEAQALAAAQEALSGVLEVMLEDGEVIPDPRVAMGGNVHLVEPFPQVAIPILLRKLRESAGLTQEELAGRLRVSYQAVQKLERPGANPTVATLHRVTKALGRRLDVSVL
ncbi:MAG: helix-turn-helix domain-containing protein [Symbiobacteriia bacterium]